MTEGSFAEFVPAEVIKQINVREEKWGKQDKTVEEFEVIHGNTVWCVLRSGVNAPKDDSVRNKLGENKATISHTDLPARQMVLGGEQKGEVPEGNQFDFNFRSGIELTNSSVSERAYNKSTPHGHRPIPGITGFSVKTKDTWGMILEANIQIKCWSRDDLEKLDLVYFKPGYPALFEWGHTLYFDKDGKVCKNPEPIVSNARFFGSETQEWTKLDEEVYEGRKKNCNREACFGYITNFSWSINPDGSYDCSLQILSKGAVLEGLTTSPTGNSDSESEKQKDQEWWKTSPYHGLLKCFCNHYNKFQPGTVQSVPSLGKLTSDKPQLDKYRKLPGRSSTSEIKEALFSCKNSISTSTYKPEFPKVSDDFFQDFPVIPVRASKGSVFIFYWGGRIEFYYMTLRSLLHIINRFDGVQNNGIFYNTTSTQKFGDSGKSHPSLNPLVALKPSQVQDADYKISDQMKPSLLSNEKDYQGDDQILNIWVNYNMFVDILNQMIATAPEGKYSIDKALTEFLQLIQKSFGNVNAFGTHADSSLGGSYLEIVDRTMVRKEDAEMKDIPKLNITGLNNTVVGLQIKSDLSNDIANEMCIAAASPVAKSDGSNLTEPGLVFWGENCEPRFLVDYKEKTDPSRVAEQVKAFNEGKGKWIEDFKKFYKDFREGRLKGKSSDNESNDAGTVVSNASEQINHHQLDGERYWRGENQEDLAKGSYLQMGLIPYKTTITLLGCSRLFIGNTFMLKNNGVLPRKYDNWGYLITGIEHIVKNNQWFTTLTTNYFPVFPDKQFASTPRASSSSGGGSSSNGGSGSGSSGNKAPQKKPNEQFENDCDYRQAFRDSGITYPNDDQSDYSGRCARYTCNWARAYVQGKSALSNGGILNQKTGRYEPAAAAGGNANQSSYWSSLEALGYTKGEEITLTGAELSKLRGGETVNGVTIKEGDVLVYDNDNHQYGHTCFYDGTRWCSDTDQRSANCYGRDGASATFKVRLFSSPPKSSDWDCGTHS